MNRTLALTGQKFERLVAVTPEGKYHYWCECICGEWVIVRINSLKSGGTKSCGCFNRERTREANTVHGMFGTPTYRSWDAMLQRCENSNYPGFQYWGGRKITVCDRWHSFENFFADIGLRPKGKSLDRWPNKNGNYEPDNCRWATIFEQNNNHRVHKPVSCGPNKQRWFRAWHKDSMAQFTSNNQSEFARQYGLDASYMTKCLNGKGRVHKGWTFQRI